MKSSFFNRLRQSPKTLYISTSLRRLQVFLLICVLTCLLGPVKGTELTTQTSDIHQILQGVTNTPPGLEDASESSFSRKGEFYLGGLFDIHLEQDGVCKAINPRGLQWMYAMVYAIELINARQDLLPNITLGFHIKDTCGNPNVAVTSSLDFITSSANLGTCKNDSTTTTSSGRLGTIVAVVGPATSNAAVSVASLFELFELPEISYSATSELLSHSSFSYFTRVVPSDIHQATALVDIVTHFNWSVVATVATDDLAYGVPGLDRFLLKSKSNGVCVALESRIGSSTTKEQLIDIVNQIRTFPKIKVIVAFANEAPMLRLLDAFAELNATGYTFIGTDGWTASPVLTSDSRISRVTRGMLGLRYRAQEVPGFLEYLHGISPSKIEYQDPFLTEYWQETFNCYIDDGSNGSGVFTKQCTGDEMLPKEDTFFKGNLVSSILDSVYVVAFALHNALKCNSTMCDANSGDVNGRNILSLMKNVSFLGYSGFNIELTTNGDLGSSASYDVFNLQPVSLCSNETVTERVGRWNLNQAFTINGTITWPSDDLCSQTAPSISICSDPCQPGYRLISSSQSKSECCWNCVQCPDNHYTMRINALTCSSCLSEEVVNAERTGCVPLPTVYLTANSPLGIVILALSTPGILIACVFGTILLCKRNTRVVVCAHAGHNVAILTSAVLCFIMSWMPLFSSTDIYCIIKAGLQLLPLALLQGTLVMTAYVSYKGRQYVTVKKRVFIMLLITCVYCTFIAVWFVTGLPRSSRTPDRMARLVYIDCNEGELFAIALSFSYSILLDIFGLFIAFKTRKKEDNCREGKFIFFSFIVHIMVWVATIGIQFAIKEGKHTRPFILVVGIIFSGYVPLMLLFVPKLYALKTKPEANSKVDAKMKRKITGKHRGKGAKRKFIPEVASARQTLLSNYHKALNAIRGEKSQSIQTAKLCFERIHEIQNGHCQRLSDKKSELYRIQQKKKMMIVSSSSMLSTRV
ncbi:extracellular calcium-sensing receptor-like [Asterias rubens]|uniref:extracellular calcium-sensing receptor-like n=1 Tax=Asterias rubens TaxID=7604 RepID=UPI001454F657|nr:extracellular calcium-sensing receptor-like [Asterias rubens]XP_033635947.1 extracellular calcium-sensing receptor-like [Asterias rubens]